MCFARYITSHYPQAFGEQLLQWLRQHDVKPKTSMDLACCTGMLCEILQKYVDHGGRLAVYGDYSGYTSKPLHDFIYGSNKGKAVFFVGTEEMARLAGK